MAATKMLRLPRPFGLKQQHSHFSTNPIYFSSNLQRFIKVNCISKQGLINGDAKPPGGGGERQLPAAAKALAPALQCVVTANPKADKGVDLNLALPLGNISDVFQKLFVIMTKRRPWKLYIQMFVEKVMIDFRFFSLFAVAGSLLGSLLCFVEGCFLVVESYLQYFHALVQSSDPGHIMHLLIEALDMFLVGTAMLTFGMSLYVMFVGSKSRLQLQGFNSFSYLKALPSWVGGNSVMQAKSKIGHAVVILLQVGVLEKFKSIPLVTGLDLACFAGAVFVSSASTFLLSRLRT